MKSTFATLLGAALLAGAIAAHAQAPAPGGPPEGKGPGRGQPRMHDCSKAPDPKACEERREKMRQAMKEAHKACEGKQGAERRDCMRQQMCAKAPDPAKCQANAKERGQRHLQRLEERQKMHEACTGKRGEELAKCLNEQRGAGRGRGDKPKS